MAAANLSMSFVGRRMYVEGHEDSVRQTRRATLPNGMKLTQSEDSRRGVERHAVFSN